MKTVCVIGGGAAGLMAAYAAAEQGNRVILLEKNEKLGKKIYITGKGRCNLTNNVPPMDFLENVVRGKKFLTGAIFAFPPEKTMEFFENYGLTLKVERGNRVFPLSDHASDVTKTLERACKAVEVDVHLNEEVLSIETMSDIGIMPRVVAVSTNKEKIPCDVVIVSTGGLSYPSTGSTGDGYRFASEAQIKVTDLKPSLCGLNLKGETHKDLQGLSLKNVALSTYLGEKKVYDGFGEALFTHFGVSGPLVLTLTSLINRMDLNNVKLFFDLKPALDADTLDKRLLRDFDKYKNKRIANALVELLPQKLIPIVLRAANIREEKAVNVVTKEERGRLVYAIKHLLFKPASLRDFSEAVVTSGGVDLSEIKPKDMSAKKVSGLKFCGEVLDVDAYTGGFNLQIAFATGYIAGHTVTGD